MSKSEKAVIKEAEKKGGKFSHKTEKLQLILKSILISFCALIKIKILPFVIIVAVILAFLPEDISIFFTWLVLCVFIYEYLPRMTEKFYDNFTKIWWIRTILIFEVLMFYFAIIFITPGSVYGQVLHYFIPKCLAHFVSSIQYPFSSLVLLFLLPILGLALLFSKIMWDKSDMAKWEGVVPQFWSAFGINPIVEVLEIKNALDKILELLAIKLKTFSFYHRLDHFLGDSFLDELLEEGFKNPPSKTQIKFFRLLATYDSALMLSLIGLLLCVFFIVFSSSSTLLVIFMIGWIVNDVFLSIKKKSIIGFIKSIFGTESIEEKVISPLFSFEKPLIKQVISIIGILITSFLLILLYIRWFFYLLVLKSFQLSHAFFILPPKTLAIVYLLFFWYIIIKRYPHFINIWRDRDFSGKVKAPSLPIIGIIIFVIDVIVITCGGYYFIIKGLGLLLSFLISLLNIFGLQILFISVRNSNKEISPKDVFKDNLYIPIAFSISYLIPMVILFYYNELSFLVIYRTSLITLLFLLVFYVDDWVRIIEKKYSEKNAKNGVN